jgi:lipopolysaccharide/colanic/teichoic acid biosynthesis glycosyltransferase
MSSATGQWRLDPAHTPASGWALDRPDTALPSWYLPCKAAAESVLALTLLVLTAPVILLAALAVKLTSRGPAFYTQVRLGLRGRPFTIYKLRTMTHDCERHTGPQWARVGDPRVTAVGRLLRRTHLDELPQLVNVLRGEMGLIGPRPERPEIVAALEQDIVAYRERLRVRPGVTGLAQIQLPPDSDVDSARRKLTYDLYYVNRLGPWLDLRILVGTAFMVVGTPFSALRVLFRMPTAERVEQDYRRFCRAPKHLALLQPV